VGIVAFFTLSRSLKQKSKVSDMSDRRLWVQYSSAVLLLPYFLVLFFSMNAPHLPLPIPNWAKKKKTKHDGALGSEISPNLRLVSPHHWPHPIWFGVIAALSWLLLKHCSIFSATAFLIAELGLLPLLVHLERRAYLAEIGESPESGFVPPPPPGIAHGTRSCLYSLYVHYVVRADVLDFSPLQHSQVASFITQELPLRGGCRPCVIRGLPQRQTDQQLPLALASVRHQKTFEFFVKQYQCCEAKVSINEGAGAHGLYCRNCKFLGSEFAHEHSVDGSWHVVLSPSDAYKVCAAGWGERGPPICCRNICQHFSFAPEGWVFIYAPTTGAEVDMLAVILRASHDFVEAEKAKND
jgi:hypothetical protein